jgi:hypothetical protein
VWRLPYRHDCWTTGRRVAESAAAGASPLDAKSDESGAEGAGGSEVGSAPAPQSLRSTGGITGGYGGTGRASGGTGSAADFPRRHDDGGKDRGASFEPHTELIRKGKASKPTELGKLVRIQEAENQIVTHFEVLAEHPADSTLLLPSIEVHQLEIGTNPAHGGGRCGI